MFKTAIGPVDDGSSFAYLRPETCQQIFTNFKNILDSTSRTVPLVLHKLERHLEMKLPLVILFLE